MNKFLVVLFSVLLVFVVAGSAEAYYITDPLTFDVADGKYIVYDPDIGKYGGGTISWEHSYAECCEEGDKIVGAWLTIVANDVDMGEIDVVSITGETSSIGQLNQLTFNNQLDIRSPNYYTHDYSNTTSDPMPIDLALLASSGGTLPIEVVVPVNFGVRIMSSTLTVECAPVPIPSALLLLGSGIVGLFGLRRKFSRK